LDILFCNCAYGDFIPAERRQKILSALLASDVNLVAIPDLCGLAASRDPLLARLAATPEPKIVACYPRAVRWLFHLGGAPLPAGHAEILNMRLQSADDILSRLSLAPRDREQATHNVAPSGEWIPWFPVIDYQRCSNCKQCLEFCLFGVYEANGDGKVKVVNPASCKTNCPACARICPQAAIIFPKVADSPINGAEIENEEQIRAAAKVNLDQFLGDDPYAALAKRRAKRKAILLRTRKQEGSLP
jgi:NAD-dependent dihydropyrimidine dehydrogenase PreA subunit